MMFTPKGARTRWSPLAAAGAAACLLALSVGRDDPAGLVGPIVRSQHGSSMAEPGRDVSAPRPSNSDAATAIWEAPAREKISPVARADLFAPKGWTPPPPRPVRAPAALPPPAPAAPPVPFKFIGQIDDRSATPAAFITRADALFVVHVGDVVENTYRVESFGPAQMVLIYLPLNQRQTIATSGG